MTSGRSGRMSFDSRASWSRRLQAGTPALTTWIGARLLAEGGNAFDAACAVGFALQVLEPHVN